MRKPSVMQDQTVLATLRGLFDDDPEGAFGVAAIEALILDEEGAPILNRNQIRAALMRLWRAGHVERLQADSRTTAWRAARGTSIAVAEPHRRLAD